MPTFLALFFLLGFVFTARSPLYAGFQFEDQQKADERERRAARADFERQRAQHANSAGARRKVAPSQTELEHYTADLQKSLDSEKRLEAIDWLAKAGEQGAQVLQTHAQRLVDALDAGKFQTREDAQTRLIEMGHFAFEAIHRAVQDKKGSAEVRFRAKQIQEKIELPWRDLADRILKSATEEGEKRQKETDDMVEEMVQHMTAQEMKQLLDLAISQFPTRENERQKRAEVVAQAYRTIYQRMGYTIKEGELPPEDDRLTWRAFFSVSKPEEPSFQVGIDSDLQCHTIQDAEIKPVVSEDDRRGIQGKSVEEIPSFGFRLIASPAGLTFVRPSTRIRLKEYLKLLYPDKVDEIDRWK